MVHSYLSRASHAKCQQLCKQVYTVNGWHILISHTSQTFSPNVVNKFNVMEIVPLVPVEPAKPVKLNGACTF